MKEVYGGKSSIEGNGLFIKEAAKKGERICYIKGRRCFKINQSVDDARKNPDWIGIAKNWWIDPAIPFKYLNHSCNPNTGIKGKVTMYALRDIKSNEELTIDYATIEGDDRWVLPAKCRCGYRFCRGRISSVHTLPVERFEAYLPYVSTYFKRLYAKQYDLDSV
jgi:SET domain-containing protein